MTSRRLTAILAADIAGYSALMGANEVETVAALKGHQSVVLPMISDFDGRVIDTAGDGILAEFPSVFNAVRCAVAIQDVMRERNSAIIPTRRMQFRIGVNQGDVLFDDDRIYGEGINIAARLEGLCEPGGICISAKVYEEVKDRFRVRYTDIGEKTLKNIAMPVRVYQIGLGGVASVHGLASNTDPDTRVAETPAGAARGRLGLPSQWRAAALGAIAAVALASVGYRVWMDVPFPSTAPATTSTSTHGPSLPNATAPAGASHDANRTVSREFDGEWEGVLTGGADCPIKSARQRFSIKDRQIILANGKTGTVDADGVVHYFLPGRADPKVVVEFTGRLTKGSGQVTYRVVRGTCIGTGVLTRIAP